ncbi:MAG: hypothetical protein ACREVJ_10435, partial [Gammaproteobacteria bacterium]
MKRLVRPLGQRGRTWIFLCALFGTAWMVPAPAQEAPPEDRVTAPTPEAPPEDEVTAPAAEAETVEEAPLVEETVIEETAVAEEPSGPTLNSGDTAWMLSATALVLFMTVPGLALFYAGMVRAKNVLSVLMQCFAITSLVTVLWMVAGYSMAFDTTGMEKGVVNLFSFIGSLNKALLAGVGRDSLTLTV